MRAARCCCTKRRSSNWSWLPFNEERNPSMSNQVALITGASRGLGLEIARAYARRGLRLILTARGADPLKQAADELATLTDVLAVAGDVADSAHAERLVRAGLARLSQIDVLINN